MDGVLEKGLTDKLSQTFSQSPFTAKEAADLLNMDPRHVTRILASALQNGLIIRVGAGRSTQYRFQAQPDASRKASVQSARRRKAA